MSLFETLSNTYVYQYDQAVQQPGVTRAPRRKRVTVTESVVPGCSKYLYNLLIGTALDFNSVAGECLPSPKIKNVIDYLAASVIDRSGSSGGEVTEPQMEEIRNNCLELVSFMKFVPIAVDSDGEYKFAIEFYSLSEARVPEKVGDYVFEGTQDEIQMIQYWIERIEAFVKAYFLWVKTQSDKRNYVYRNLKTNPVYDLVAISYVLRRAIDQTSDMPDWAINMLAFAQDTKVDVEMFLLSDKATGSSILKAYKDGRTGKVISLDRTRKVQSDNGVVEDVPFKITKVEFHNVFGHSFTHEISQSISKPLPPRRNNDLELEDTPMLF